MREIAALFAALMIHPVLRWSGVQFLYRCDATLRSTDFYIAREQRHVTTMMVYSLAHGSESPCFTRLTMTSAYLASYCALASSRSCVSTSTRPVSFFFFFLNDTAPPDIYPLPPHAALPI